MVPGTEAWLLGREGRRSAWVLYIIFDYINYPPTPLAAGGARQRRNYQSLQAARARSNKTRNKKQEARSGYRQQAARSKKLEARKQQALEDRSESSFSWRFRKLGRRLEDSSES